MPIENQRCPGCAGRVRVLELPWGPSAHFVHVSPCKFAQQPAEVPDSEDDKRGAHARDSLVGNPGIGFYREHTEKLKLERRK